MLIENHFSDTRLAMYMQHLFCCEVNHTYYVSGNHLTSSCVDCGVKHITDLDRRPPFVTWNLHPLLFSEALSTQFASVGMIVVSACFPHLFILVLSEKKPNKISMDLTTSMRY